MYFQRGPFTRARLLPSPHLFEPWQGAESSRSVVKRRRRRRQRQQQQQRLRTRSFPSVPSFSVMQRNPGESLPTSNRCGKDAGSPRGDQASAQGTRSPRGA
ncbi:hypothetical protein U0070_008341 [Myodes glareolus]|uniref:Uncharacterized protein n=1 Tax=Myodes glareolus TaxID=447135 RepID=A0AAW0IXI4_MYOGA